MDILNFKKSKDGFYILKLDNNEKISIHEDLILKYNLLIKKTLDNRLKDKLLNENQMYYFYNKAIKYISIKMRSVKEVRIFLSKEEDYNNSIDNIINKLLDQGYLNDLEYTKAFINDRINLSNDGPKKIVLALKKNGIKEEMINDLITVYSSEIEKERIERIINKEMKLNTNKGSRLLKQKIQSDLVNLGYTLETIYSCLESFNYDDTSLYKKEYEKLYKKYSNKYSGSSLEYYIKQKLYQKGFNIYD